MKPADAGASGRQRRALTARRDVGATILKTLAAAVSRISTSMFTSGVFGALTALLLSGCMSFVPQPPADLQYEAQELAERVERIDGVAAAHGEVHDIDWKDRPGEWRASLVVRADTIDLQYLADELRPELERTRIARNSVDLALQIPGTTQLAPVTLGNLSPGVITTIEVIRAYPEVIEVNASAFVNPNVRMRQSVSLSEAVNVLRQASIAGDPSGTLTAAWQPDAASRSDITIDVNADWPTSAVLDALTELERLPSTTDIWARGPSAERNAGYVAVTSTDEPAALEIIERVTSRPTETTIFRVDPPT
ncbi:hypothetical protein [Agromyces sp. LHK192]|uniref:hypothetical protein n=1 Tax=Agromyces sp. LHK192 TaxID=2498704 RepID=UPI000FDAC87B|nr:hypothetical protein [Agromyces sp. LHK192]